MPIRIRVFFINCHALDIDAAAYLILAQNKQQSLFQFEIHHFSIYSKKAEGGLTGLSRPIYVAANLVENIGNWLGRKSNWWNILFLILEKFFKGIANWLERHNRVKFDLRAAPIFKMPIVMGNWYQELHDVIEKYDQWVDRRAPAANNYDSVRGPSIVITESPFQDHFISFSNRDLSIISAREWKNYFWPVSALEYILSSVQRTSLYLAFSPNIESHYPTRACLWDYSMNQPDFRHSMLLGFLCETCRNGLKNAISDQQFTEINQLIENSWIGESGSPFSIAGTLSRIYRYELSRATGLSSGVGSTIRYYIRTGFGQAIVEVIKWAFIFALTAFAVSRFPSVVAMMRTF